MIIPDIGEVWAVRPSIFAGSMKGYTVHLQIADEDGVAMCSGKLTGEVDPDGRILVEIVAVPAQEGDTG